MERGRLLPLSPAKLASLPKGSDLVPWASSLRKSASKLAHSKWLSLMVKVNTSIDVLIKRVPRRGFSTLITTVRIDMECGRLLPLSLSKLACGITQIDLVPQGSPA